MTHTPETRYATGVDRDEIMHVLRAFHGLIRATEDLDFLIRAKTALMHQESDLYEV